MLTGWCEAAAKHLREYSMMLAAASSKCIRTRRQSVYRQEARAILRSNYYIVWFSFFETPPIPAARRGGRCQKKFPDPHLPRALLQAPLPMQKRDLETMLQQPIKRTQRKKHSAYAVIASGSLEKVGNAPLLPTLRTPLLPSLRTGLRPESPYNSWPSGFEVPLAEGGNSTLREAVIQPRS